MEEKNWKAEIKRLVDDTLSDIEALEELNKTKIFISLGRRNGKNRAYLALMKAYFALEEKAKGENRNDGRSESKEK